MRQINLSARQIEDIVESIVGTKSGLADVVQAHGIDYQRLSSTSRVLLTSSIFMCVICERWRAVTSIDGVEPDTCELCASLIND